MRTHDDYIMNQRQKRKAQEAHLEDAEEQIKAARASHVELMGRQGQMLAEEQVFRSSDILVSEALLTKPFQTIEQRMAEREELVRELATKYHIKGVEQSPLEREEASQFLSNLNDVKRRQHAETDRLQVYDSPCFSAMLLT